MSTTDRSRVRTLAIAAIPLLLGACAHPETIVLLPEKDGRSTAVVVKQDGRETVLDQPYAAARQTPFGLRPYTSTPEEVASKFGSTLAANRSSGGVRLLRRRQRLLTEESSGSSK